VLREAARQVGVSATAAYRHFAGHGDLMQTVKHRALAALASSMERELAAGRVEPDPAEDALRRLRALSTGYVRFARSEPGLFRAAFCHVPGPQPRLSEAAGQPPLTEPRDSAFQMLCKALDDLVANGLMPAQRREHAPLAAWSIVHGLAMLLLDGPYAHLTGEQADAVMRSTVDVAIHGFCGR
jgi:AcrR family transcriptional regulator